MLEDVVMAELIWTRDKMDRVQRLAMDYVDALARHHVARDGDNRSKLAGDCFNVRSEFEAVIREVFQHNGSEHDGDDLLSFANQTLQD